jgi:hypothetical protein
VWLVTWVDFDILVGHREAKDREVRTKLSVRDPFGKAQAEQEARLLWSRRQAQGMKQVRRTGASVTYPHSPKIVYEEKL